MAIWVTVTASTTFIQLAVHGHFVVLSLVQNTLKLFQVRENEEYL